MSTLNIGDIVARKSYGNDIHFIITAITYDENQKPIYTLRGLLKRIEADSNGFDLIKSNPRQVNKDKTIYLQRTKQQLLSRNLQSRIFGFNRPQGIPGKILHIDSSEDFLKICIKYYRDSNVPCIGHLAPEREQSYVVEELLHKHKPNILVLTGHDGLKKGSTNLKNMDNYRTSKYFVNAVLSARNYEPDKNKLCIFAGACQSYFEAIMDSGANFASSPERVLIDCLDPSIVTAKVSQTDHMKIITPSSIYPLTKSGKKGIGGINSRGQMFFN